MDEQDQGWRTPMNSLRRTITPAALPILPIALAAFLMLTPVASASASAQTPSGAAEHDDENEDESGVPARGGLGWTGIGLMSAGGLLLAGSFTFNDSKGCGFFNELACRDVGRVYGTTGGVMVGTGLVFLLIDEVRRHPEPYPRVSRTARRPARQTVIAIGPRAIQVRMLF
jgi:hypothetical protein